MPCSAWKRPTQWCYFLKHAGELEVIPAKLDHPPFRKAFEIASRANMTKEECEAYDATAVRIQDERGIATAAYKEGQRHGERFGMRGVFLALRQQGYNLEQIAEMTGYSHELIEDLLKERA